MIDLYAAANIATMKNVHTWKNWTAHAFPHHAMCFLKFSLLPNKSVTGIIFMT